MSLVSSRWVFLVTLVVLGLGFVLIHALVDTPVSGKEREQVQLAAVALLTADAAIGQMPADLDQRRRVFTDEAAKRRSALSKIWAPAVTTRKFAQWESALGAVASDPNYDAYVDNRYVVEEWQKFQHVPGGVKVVVRGHMEYRDAQSGKWVGSADGTEHLKLVRVTGRWRLKHVSVSNWNPS